MGASLHDLNDLPEINDIVWCKWPHRQNPGNERKVRPVLVRDRDIRQALDGKFGTLTVAYGTSTFDQPDTAKDLLIGWPHFQRMGLHKPTLFSLDPRDRKLFLWSGENFLPPEYLRERKIIVGRLDREHSKKLELCCAARKAEAR